MGSIKHRFVSGKSDGGDATLVRPSNWNDVHTSPFSFDSIDLDGTYGDEFDGTSLNGRWTAQGSFVANAAVFALNETWLQFVGRGTSAMSIYQTGPSKDILEVIVAMSQNGGAVMEGPAIVSSSGVGVLASLRSDVTNFVLNNVSSYAYTSDGIAVSLGAGLEYSRGVKHWISLRKFKSALSGDIYFARFSLDGNTWSKPLRYVPSTFTYAKIGWGRLYGGANDDRNAIDRFNVRNALNLGNNLVRTPTSGTPTYTASSQFSGSFSPDKAADGNNGTDWSASNGAADSPLYWQVAWSVGQTINRVLFKERTGDAFGIAHLEAYDGATTTYIPLEDFVAGSALWHLVEFPTLTGITTLRLVGDGGAAANCGLIEFEAYLAS